MRILLLHAEDSALTGPWAGQKWDAVIDLARAGWAAYERWSRALGCSVRPLDAVRDGIAEIERVRALLQCGLGRLTDRDGLDWWELAAIMVHHRLEDLVLLRKLARSLPDDAEVWVTRAGFEAEVLRDVLGARLHVSAPSAPRPGGLGHYVNRLRQLPSAQVIQILGDKFDPGYRVRRRWHKRSQGGHNRVVLAPTSYVNMSRTVAGFATVLPSREFLLVATRSSGRLQTAPGNLRQEWLASYAGGDGREELPRILERWEILKKDLREVPEWSAMERFGLMDDFPRRFAEGLAIRDAWLRVFDRERVAAVLCCDDSNPHTHIPLLLAARRELPTVACHHGALDGRYLIKSRHADVVLAKGRMEQDYLVNFCGLAASNVQIGAPAGHTSPEGARGPEGDCIVFFSEPYEMSAGRTVEFYRDALPRLADLAARTGKKMAMKLHPSENLRDRQALVARLLDDRQRAAVQWLSGPLDQALLKRVWFGVTVQSSVAVECAVHGVPCFLCEWLDLWPYGYVTQFRKFGVGIGLRAPEEITSIPETLARWNPSRRVAEDCCQQITPQHLDDILSGKRTPQPVPLGMQRSG